MKFGVPFHAVMATLADVFEVSRPDESKLLARLRNMQREGFPPGVNVGRGVKVSYGIDHITAVLFYHSLIDAGFPPDFAIRAFVTHRELILATALHDERAFDPDQAWPGGASLVLVLSGRLLGSKAPSTSEQRPLLGKLEAKLLIEVHAQLGELISRPSGLHILDVAGALATALRSLSAADFTTTSQVKDAIRECSRSMGQGQADGAL